MSKFASHAWRLKFGHTNWGPLSKDFNIVKHSLRPRRTPMFSITRCARVLSYTYVRASPCPLTLALRTVALRTWSPIQFGILKLNKNGWIPLSARRNVRVLSQPLRHQNELGFKTEGRDPIFGQHSYLPLRTQDVICGEIRTL